MPTLPPWRQRSRKDVDVCRFAVRPTDSRLPLSFVCVGGASSSRGGAARCGACSCELPLRACCERAALEGCLRRHAKRVSTESAAKSARQRRPGRSMPSGFRRMHRSGAGVRSDAGVLDRTDVGSTAKGSFAAYDSPDCRRGSCCAAEMRPIFTCRRARRRKPWSFALRRCVSSQERWQSGELRVPSPYVRRQTKIGRRHASPPRRSLQRLGGFLADQGAPPPRPVARGAIRNPVPAGLRLFRFGG